MSETEEPEAAAEEQTATEDPAADIEGSIDAATEAVRAQTEEIDELAATAPTGSPMGMGQLMDVPVQVTVEVGRARMTLAELIEVGAGSVLELDRGAHEPADILVNGKVVARGEIVTVGDCYGVRITNVQGG